MNIKPYILPILTVTLVGLFVSMSYFSFKSSSKQLNIAIMSEDINNLKNIFNRIQATCRIIDFDAQKNIINFLNVGNFEGSEVGPMNLAYPDKWEGPYVDDNPTMQTLEYQVVKTKKGYFITPGDGVELPNGKIIGKDIPLTENTDIEQLMKTDLLMEGKVLAAPIETDPNRATELLDTLLRPNGGMVKIDYANQRVTAA